eukprot:15432177-Alexandrium_andersonii.AAC.1
MARAAGSGILHGLADTATPSMTLAADGLWHESYQPKVRRGQLDRRGLARYQPRDVQGPPEIQGGERFGGCTF